MKKRIEGFTLTELMVVMGIIAFLAALIILSFNLQLFKGKDAKKKGDLDRIKIAIEEYEKDKDCYPPAEDMVLCGTNSTIAVHPYLSNVPCDPVTGDPYYYEPDPDNPSCPRWFRLYSELQNENDPKIITNIGPGNAYNFYVSSDNAPDPERCSGSETYGCFGSQCRKVCPGECTNLFSESTCGGIGNCGSSQNTECSPP